MAADVELGESFLRVTVKAIAALIPGGSIASLVFEEVASAFAKAGWAWLRKLAPATQQTAIDSLARMQPDRANQIALGELQGTNLDGRKKADLAQYLAFVPMQTRQSLRRPDDGGRPQTLLSQLPRDERALLSFLPLRPPRFRVGDRIPHHDYQLDALLGQGGFGEVWKATNVRRQAEPPVAIKFCLDPKLVASLHREVLLLDQLEQAGQNKYVVRLVTTALSSDPPFLVFEYVNGGDLAAWLAMFQGHGAPAREVARVLTMVARGLKFAHERGVVHHDLKPSNLLVTREGLVKIADFGIGRLVQAASPAPGALTRPMTLFDGAGTPAYTDSQSYGTQRDVFALGVIAYQLLAGDIYRSVPPNWMSVLARAGTPTALINFVERCLEVPDQRFADANAALAALEAMDATHSGKKTITDVIKSGAAGGWRRYLPTAAAAVILAVTLIVVGRRQVPPATTANAGVIPVGQPNGSPTRTNGPRSGSAGSAAGADGKDRGVVLIEKLETGEVTNTAVSGGSGGREEGGGRGGGGGTKSRVSRADVIPGAANVRGSLDTEIIRRVIKRHLNEVKSCYQQGLRTDPDLGGRIMVQFTIAASGQVIASVLQNSTLGNARVENCIVPAVRRWEFPKPLGGGIVIVSYPFVLTPAEGGPLLRARRTSPAAPDPGPSEEAGEIAE